MRQFSPDDRTLAQTFIACMDDKSPTARPLTLADPREGGGDVADTQKWSAAVLLVAMVRKLGWTPPPETIDTHP